MLFLALATLAQAAQHQPADPKVVVLVGATGAGKSLFGNLLADRVAEPQLFTTGGGLGYVTHECREQFIQLLQLPRELRATTRRIPLLDRMGSNGAFGEIENFLTPTPTDVLVVDTPGLGDGHDNIRCIADKINELDQRYGGVDRFIIVINGAEARYTDSLHNALLQFQLGFTGADHSTEDWLRRVTFVFTNWGYSQTDINTRRRQRRPTEDDLRTTFNSRVAETLGLSEEYIRENPVPCLFIDTWSAAGCLPQSRQDLIASGEYIEEELVRRDSEEYLQYVRQLADLRQQISQAERFPCSHISAAEVVRKRMEAGNFNGITDVCCTCNEFTGVNMRDYKDDPLGDIRGPGYKCRYCSNYGHRYATDLAVATREGMRYGAYTGYGVGAVAGGYMGCTWVASAAYGLGIGKSILAVCVCWALPVGIVVVPAAFLAIGCGAVGALVGAGAGGAGAIPYGAIHAAAYSPQALEDAPERVTLDDGSTLHILRRANRGPLPVTQQGIEIEMTNRN